MKKVKVVCLAMFQEHKATQIAVLNSGGTAMLYVQPKNEKGQGCVSCNVSRR